MAVCPQCGIELYLYLGAARSVVVAGVWSGICSLETPDGLAHYARRLMVVLMGHGPARREILPRSATRSRPRLLDRACNLPEWPTTFKNSHCREMGAAAWTGVYFENRNPADTPDLIGRFPDSGSGRYRRRGAVRPSRIPGVVPHSGAGAGAICCAGWATCSSEKKEDLADRMSREMGKVLTETRGDVQEGIDTAYYAAGEGRRLFGHTVPSELRNKWAMSYRRPIGVAGLITPFNFPHGDPDLENVSRVAVWKQRDVQALGRRPHRAHRLVELVLEAGLSAGRRSSWSMAGAKSRARRW